MSSRDDASAACVPDQQWTINGNYGYKSAIWAIAHRLCRLLWKILHERVRFVEAGGEPSPRAKRQRAQRLLRSLRRLGYQVTVNPLPAEA